MERPKLNFVPTFDMVQSCAVGVAWQNLWRVQPAHDFDDLMAEARYVFVKITKHYPLIRNERHFGSLFYRAFVNRIHRLALAVTKERPVMSFNASRLSDNTHILDCFKHRGSGYDQAQQIIRTEGAPAPVLKLLQRIEERGQCNFQEWELCPKYSHIKDESLRLKLVNEWLCVIAGVPTGTNMIEMVKNWLYGEPQPC